MSSFETRSILRIKADSDESLFSLSESFPNALQIQGKTFTFDKILTNESQSEVFKEFSKLISESSMNELDILIFAYGQSGSGKTYSLFGNSDNAEEFGLIPRTFDLLFSQKSPKCIVKVSFYEIYNEHIYDLLDCEVNKKNRTSLHTRENPQDGVYIENIKMQSLRSFEEVKTILNASNRRVVNSTQMNSDSSRSHAILEIGVSKGKREHKITFVDLAGSERLKETGATGVVIKEANFINNSLSTLGTIINDLSKANPKHIPFRNCKLTFCLKNSLTSGNLVLLATIRSCKNYLTTTLNTLNFSQRVKNIKMKSIEIDREKDLENEDLIEVLFESRKRFEFLKMNPSNDKKHFNYLKDLNDLAIKKLLEQKSVDATEDTIALTNQLNENLYQNEFLLNKLSEKLSGVKKSKPQDLPLTSLKKRGNSNDGNKTKLIKLNMRTSEMKEKLNLLTHSFDSYVPYQLSNNNEILIDLTNSPKHQNLKNNQRTKKLRIDNNVKRRKIKYLNGISENPIIID